MHKRCTARTALAGSLALAMANGASAQPTDDTTGHSAASESNATVAGVQLEEVIVTARRREDDHWYGPLSAQAGPRQDQGAPPGRSDPAIVLLGDRAECSSGRLVPLESHDCGGVRGRNYRTKDKPHETVRRPPRSTRPSDHWRGVTARTECNRQPPRPRASGEPRPGRLLRA